MFEQNPQLRYLRPVALTSVLLLGLCAFTAFFLLQQQESASEELHQDLSKRRAASALLETLFDLNGLLQERVAKVDVIHLRIEKHLENIRKCAVKPRDLAAVERLDNSYNRYQDAWKQVTQSSANRAPDFHEAAQILDSQLLPLCQELVDSSSREMQRSEQKHQQALRWLAWGMGGVGVTGAIAGLVLGYGVARGLSRTIQRLQIRLKDVAGKMGSDLPEIVLTGEGDLSRLEGQVQELMERIERLVGRLQQREREVLRAEQLAAVGQLAAGVAHEIRNPLTSIKMLVQAGQEDQAGLSADDLQIIERETLRMERSLKVFLDFARLPKPERSEQDLAVIAEQTLDLIRGRAAKQHVDLKLISPASSVRVEVDGEQIRQVLVNLSLNALDAMPTGGTLEMIIKTYPGLVEISVADTGPGISPEIMPRLFEPFISTKETGLGLGLVISRRIAEEHGGQLCVSNRVTGGACFTLSLGSATSDDGGPLPARRDSAHSTA